MTTRTSARTIATIAAALSAALVATAAEARCTKLAFSVNDYGKDGPAKDAQRLLDTYIAKWGADRGIKQLTVGKKDVTCELFLDVGLFDEHTCKAAATVCWPGNEDYANKVPVPGTGAPVKAAAAAKPAAARPAAATKTAEKTSPITTGAIPVPAAPAVAKAETPAPVPAPVAPVAPTPAATAPAEAAKAQ
jgi:hypothetical protein